MSDGFGAPLFVLGLAAVPAAPPAPAGFRSPVFILGVAGTPGVTPPASSEAEYQPTWRPRRR